MTERKWIVWLIIGIVLVLLIAAILVYAYIVPPGSRFDYESEYTKQNKTKFIELDDVKLHYLQKGLGEPLILIHGGGAWLYTFRNNIEELAKHFTVYAVDMPGHGYTGYTEGVKMDLNYTSGVLKAFMEKTGIAKASFVGNSWGGGWALDFVQKYPDKADKLVLIDATGLKDSVKRDQSIWPSMRYPVLGELIAHFFTYNNVKDGYVFNDKSKLDESVYREFYKPLSLSRNLRSQYLYQRGLDWSETDAKLDTMTTPTMILWGRQDTIYQAGMAEEYARRIPSSTVHIIEEAGHLPHEEQPEQVNKLLMDFLTQP